MALIYTFSFDSRYVGYEATITDADGAEVAGSPVTLDAAGDGTISLTTLGHYRAAVFNTSGPFGDGYSVVDCVLDGAASIAAGGDPLPSGGTTAQVLTKASNADGDADWADVVVPGASETAYFTGVLVGVTDNQSGPVTLVAVGVLPDWVTIVAGEAVLGEAAGGCFVSATAQTDEDFTATTAPDDPGDSGAYYALTRNGDSIVDLDAGTTTGTGDDLVSLPVVDPDGAFIFGGTIAFEAAAFAHDAAADPILDGVATHQVAVNVTRLAPAPALS